MVKTKFSKDFDRIWMKYQKVNSVPVILTGKKSPMMNFVPIFEINGIYDGWNEQSLRQIETGEDYGSTLKISLSDLEATFSQPGVLNSGGRKTSIVSVLNSSHEEYLIYDNLIIGNVYSIFVEYSTDEEENVVIFKNEYDKVYSNVIYDNDSKQAEIRFIAEGEVLVVDLQNTSLIANKIIVYSFDGALKCPVSNLKTAIDYITIGDRTFNIDGQKLSASNSLMILDLSNIT